VIPGSNPRGACFFFFFFFFLEIKKISRAENIILGYAILTPIDMSKKRTADWLQGFKDLSSKETNTKPNSKPKPKV